MPLDYRIAERTLANGLRVIVSEDHSVPVVAVNLWVQRRLPARDAGAHRLRAPVRAPDVPGLAPRRRRRALRALMAEGGRLNATTCFDRTNYFETVPTGALDWRCGWRPTGMASCSTP